MSIRVTSDYYFPKRRQMVFTTITPWADSKEPLVVDPNGPSWTTWCLTAMKYEVWLPLTDVRIMGQQVQLSFGDTFP